MSEPAYPQYSYTTHLKLAELAEANDSRLVTMVWDRQRDLLTADVANVGLSTYMYDEKTPVLPVAQPNGNGHANGNGRKKALPKPHWNRRDLVLSVQGVVVKEVVPCAYNQIEVLDKFQTSGWVKRLVRPLAEEPDKVYSEILHETVRRLMHAQINRLLAFPRDGTGAAISWEYTAEGLAVIERCQEHVLVG